MRPALKVIVAFDFFNPGDTLQPTGVYYDWLVDNGYCEPDKVGIECAALDTSDAERAVLPTPMKRKRGRPRKVVQP